MKMYLRNNHLKVDNVRAYLIVFGILFQILGPTAFVGNWHDFRLK